MTDLRASDFPELRRMFSAYLHEDFVTEYGSPEAALGAFLADASGREHRAFTREMRRFLEATTSLEFSAVQTLIERLGSRWIPSSRDTLIAWVSPRIE
jgi:CdiI immunity protein